MSPDIVFVKSGGSFGVDRFVARYEVYSFG
jgi:hypothetical protein